MLFFFFLLIVLLFLSTLPSVLILGTRSRQTVWTQLFVLKCLSTGGLNHDPIRGDGRSYCREAPLVVEVLCLAGHCQPCFQAVAFQRGEHLWRVEPFALVALHTNRLPLWPVDKWNCFIQLGGVRAVLGHPHALIWGVWKWGSRLRVLQQTSLSSPGTYFSMV